MVGVQTPTNIRVFRKARKKQHHNPEFGSKPGVRFKKNLLKSTIAFKRG
jgi:hypothetical protein